MTTTADKSRVGGDTLEFRLDKSVTGTLASPGPAYRAGGMPDRAFMDAVFDEMLRKAFPKAAVTVTPAPLPELSPATEVLELVRSSLLASSGQEWIQFWLHQERHERFNRLLDGIFETLVRKCSAEEIQRDQRECQSSVVDRFPELEERLVFAESTLTRAFRIVSQMRKVEVRTEQGRYEDAHHANVFNSCYGWYRIALNTLHVVSHEGAGDTPDDLVVKVSVMVKEAALAAYHSALEGRRIRDEQSAAPTVAPTGSELSDEGLDDGDLADVENYIERFEGP